eukprot:5542617-Pleurochrysis_carterae.AAC.1
MIEALLDSSSSNSRDASDTQSSEQDYDPAYPFRDPFDSAEAEAAWRARIAAAASAPTNAARRSRAAAAKLTAAASASVGKANAAYRAQAASSASAPASVTLTLPKESFDALLLARDQAYTPDAQTKRRREAPQFHRPFPQSTPPNFIIASLAVASFSCVSNLTYP